jgi:hypothetical protein
MGFNPRTPKAAGLGQLWSIAGGRIVFRAVSADEGLSLGSPKPPRLTA